MNAKQLKAMQEGRERAQRQRTKRAIKRVKAHRKWCVESAAHMQRERQLEAAGVEPGEVRRRVGSIPRMSTDAREVTDADYRLAREAGAIV